MQILKIFRGSMSPAVLPYSHFFSSIRFKLILPKRVTFKKMSKFNFPTLSKMFEYAPDLNTSSKFLFTLFSNPWSLHSLNKKISNLYSTFSITLKSLTSDGAHLRGIIAPTYNTETSQRWRQCLI